MERGFILLGISLSELKVKPHIEPSCLWNVSVQFDHSMLQISSGFVCSHMLFVWLCDFDLEAAQPALKQTYLRLVICFHALNAEDGFQCLYLFTCRTTCLGRPVSRAFLPAPTMAHWESYHFLSKQEDVMQGCEWVLRSGPRCARLAEHRCERWLHDNGLPGKGFSFLHRRKPAV